VAEDELVRIWHEVIFVQFIANTVWRYLAKTDVLSYLKPKVNVTEIFSFTALVESES